MDAQGHEDEAFEVVFAHFGLAGIADQAKGEDAAQDDVGSFDPVFIEVPKPGDEVGDMCRGLFGIAKVEASQHQRHEDIGGEEESEEAFFVDMVGYMGNHHEASIEFGVENAIENIDKRTNGDGSCLLTTCWCLPMGYFK